MPHPSTAALEALDANDRDVLVVLCLCDEPWISRSAWKDRVNIAGIVDDRGRQLTGEAFKAMLVRLREQGFSAAAGNGYTLALPWLAPVLDDARRRGRLVPIADRLAAEKGRFGYSWRRDRLGVKADLRFALATGTADDLARAEETFAHHERISGTYPITLVDALGLDVPAAWIARLDDRRRSQYLEEACQRAFVEVRALGAGLREAIVASGNPELRARLSTLLALEGKAAEARELAAAASCAWERGALAFVALTEGDHAKARELFALAAVGSRKQRVELPSYLAVFDILLAATSDDAATVTEVAGRIQKASRQLKPHVAARHALEELAAFRATGRTSVELSRYIEPTWIDALVTRLARAWTGKGRSAEGRDGHRAGYGDVRDDTFAGGHPISSSRTKRKKMRSTKSSGTSSLMASAG